MIPESMEWSKKLHLKILTVFVGHHTPVGVGGLYFLWHFSVGGGVDRPVSTPPKHVHCTSNVQQVLSTDSNWKVICQIFTGAFMLYIRMIVFLLFSCLFLVNIRWNWIIALCKTTKVLLIFEKSLQTRKLWVVGTNKN